MKSKQNKRENSSPVFQNSWLANANHERKEHTNGFANCLAGNPNSGKTTLFNALTGSNQFVGNWPGVTVEKKKVSLKNTTA